jgi:hypothetical protein
MSFIRPEIRAAMFRWREALVGAGILLIGFYWSFGVLPGLLSWIGYLALFLGAALFFAGLQRGRARMGGGGPGIVQVVERRIGYFGPLNGGLVDLDAVTSISLDPTEHPRHWVITHEGGPPLHIPVNAEGADVLFDAFASLPGLSPGRVASTLKHEGVGPIVLWRRPDLEKRIARLH